MSVIADNDSRQRNTSIANAFPNVELNKNPILQQPITPGIRRHTVRNEDTFASRNIWNEPENRTINPPQRIATPQMEPSRFNPYLAPEGDPVLSRLLLSSEFYRVVWIIIQPSCVFSMRTYSPTMVTI